jgi:hypothetical protein
MALTCPADLTGIDYGFTSFVDCASVSINYDQLGIATISFTVVSVSNTPSGDYTTMIFGGVTFTGVITSLEIRRIPGALVYEHRYTLTGYGC